MERMDEMFTNVLEFLERTAERVPERVAFFDEREEMDFGTLRERARRIGTAIARMGVGRRPVAVLMEGRSIWNVPVMFGAVYAGCAYAVVDVTMPGERLAGILRGLGAGVVLVDEKGREVVEGLGAVAAGLESGAVGSEICAAWLESGVAGAEIRAAGLGLCAAGSEVGAPGLVEVCAGAPGGQALFGAVLSYEDAVRVEPDAAVLEEIRRRSSVYDPVSILYTSGSTGIPKGSVQTHFSYLHWTEATIAAYGFDENVIFGNQSPFFYANSIIDVFPPVALGAAVYLLPVGVLSFPKKFIECLNRNHVTELTMTPSSFVGVTDALEAGCLPKLRYGIMSGEAMPWRPLVAWMEAAPNARWWNFYGSTEAFSVAVGKVEGPPKEREPLPVGRPFPLAHLLFVDEAGREVPAGTPGEMLVSSPWISAGYYQDGTRTAAAWVNDPLKKGWQERFYHTGDVGYLREDGQLVVLGRRDAQVKHLGYRMELGEVEAALRAIPGWKDGCVLFQKETGKLWCFFVGELEEKEMRKALKGRLAGYMVPERFVRLGEMPRTASGKLDRAGLVERMREG
ncbi:MAG: AMP-binding protein [Eubacteriales bacterium]|nr:AMP-binding protein [Eubacteriales bacterium]